MARSKYVIPDSHGVNEMSWSSAHSNVAPAWSASNVNVALVLSVGSTGDVRIVVSGGGVTRQLRLAGVRSTLFAASRARTRNWWTPTDRSLSSAGEVQVLYVAPSSEHSKVTPASLDENVRLALVLAVSASGPVRIVVSGAVVSGGGSTTQV
jgi:hypothetical protein